MSNEVQRLIRKLQPKGPRSFDEQTWPIYVAIVVLCGYLSGVVISILQFNDARWHANAFTWLAVLAILGCVAAWSVSLLQNAIIRRTLILSVLLSLIINLSLLVMMAWTWIFSSTWDDDAKVTVVRPQKPDVVIPEYPLFNDDQRQNIPQEYERPVETGEANAQARIELTRQSTQPDMQSNDAAMSASNANVESTSPMQPRRVDAPSAPRLHDSLAKLSRQPLRSDLRISERPDVAAAPPSNPATSELQANQQATASRQQTIEAPAEPRPESAPERINTSAPAKRSESNADESAIASLPTLRQRIRRPRQLPNTSTPVDGGMSRPQRLESAVSPNSTLMTKRTTSAPDSLAQTDLQPKVATRLNRENQMDQPITETISDTTPRNSIAQSANTDTTVESTSQVSDTANRETALTASAANVAQRATQAAGEAQADTSNAGPQPRLTPSSQAVARNESVAQPSVSPAATTERSLTRASQIARATTSTATEATASLESIAESADSAPASEPSRMALSRSSVGVAGVGNANNLERGVAAPEVPINIASSSANRARATQDSPTGPALAPSKPTLTRQMRANRDSPNTSMRAQPIDTAMVAGTQSPSAQAASSAATLQRASSNAPADMTTAAKGTTEIDLGPTRIATDTGAGRAEGGGQPEIATGQQPRALPRENAVAGKTQIRTDTTAAQAASPAAINGGSPSNNVATATGVEVARADSNSAANRGQGDSAQLTGVEVGDVRIARATGERASQTPADSAPLAPGGNARPGRTSRSLQIRTAADSAIPSLAGLEASSGQQSGDPLDAQGTRPQRASAGILTDSGNELGAAAAEFAATGDVDSLPTPTFSRGGENDLATNDGVATDSPRVGARRRSRDVSVSGASTEVELDPEEFAANLPSSNLEDTLTGTDGLAADNSDARVSGGTLLIEIEAPDGDGGLATRPSVDAGITARTATDDSELVSLQPSRFLRRTRLRAAVSTKTDVVTPTKAFRRRIVRKGEELAGERGLPSPKTEAAIELGLVFLSRYQSADGSWSFNNFADGKAELPAGEEAIIVSDTAATGLSLLCYLGAGYHHKADKYQERIKNGIDFLVLHQKEDGDLYIDQDPNSSRSAWMYSHAIGALALCEAYGMTQDPELKNAAQKAINFIIEGQHPSRGGWRYSPAYGSDTSVSGWMTMALKSAELAELRVPESVYENIEHWLDLAQVSDEQAYLYRYNPYAPDTDRQRHGRRPTRAITAVGLLMRLYSGWTRTDPRMILGAKTLAQNPPELGTSSRPRRDTYYWYYATQVMFHMGGDYWSTWNQALHPMLSQSQIKDGPFSGSWNPQTPIPDRWGSYGGRLYVTTMNLLSLEVFYRHLPLYEETSK